MNSPRKGYPHVHEIKPPSDFLYRYRALILEYDFASDKKTKWVYDADTITILVDLGFGTYRKMRFRFYGIDALEVRGPEKVKGKVARDWLIKRLPINEWITIQSIKDKKGKYRYLCVPFVRDDNICIELINEGYAEENYYT